ncbi:MAG TPA: GLUG motif-containing protein [Sedimentisphaerales bacterium]|nr:GLUG motif-containing protein [Sedimentisphaerales bacterium]
MNNDLDAWYELGNDIDANGYNFTPVGNADNNFSGHFNGKDFMIINLVVNGTIQKHTGLLGYTTAESEIKNVGLINTTTPNSWWNYGIAGSLIGCNRGAITNCYTREAIVNNTRGFGVIGGLVGSNYGSIINSHSTGTVEGVHSQTHEVGGLVGINSGTITNSYSAATVINGFYGYHYAGGLVGSNSGTITSSYASGSVSEGKHNGGLVGENSGNIFNSYSTGNVSSQYYAGGFVYKNSGDINNSYSQGNVHIGFYYAGGFAYTNYGNITNSYSTGNVSTGHGAIFGFVGVQGGSATCNNCFWDVNTSGLGTSACGTGKTTAEMKQQATFTNWDFLNVWGILEDSTYPFLRGTPEEPVVTGFSQVEPLSWTSAIRDDVSANLNQPTIETESYVLATSAPGEQVSYTKHNFHEDGDSVSWDPGTTYVGDQVANDSLRATANPLTGLAPLHNIATVGHAEGSLRVDANGPLTSTTVAFDISIPVTVAGYGSTVVDRPDALLRATYQTALVLLGRYDLAAFDLAKDAMAERIKNETGVTVIVEPYIPGQELDLVNALFTAFICHSLDNAYQSKFEAFTRIYFDCPLAQEPETGYPLTTTCREYGYLQPTQGPFGNFVKSGILELQKVVKVPTNTDIPYTIDLGAEATCWGFAGAMSHTKGYTVQFTELSTGQSITENTVITNAPEPKMMWAEPESEFHLDIVGDVHATHSLEDYLGQPVIIPTDGNEFVVMVEQSPCLYSLAMPLGFDANELSVDLDIILTGPLSDLGQKKLVVSLVDSENNSIGLLDKDLAEYTYDAFGPSGEFSLQTGFFTVTSDVSEMAGKDATLMFLLMGKGDDPNRAGLIIDNIRGFAAPVPKASNGDLDDNGKVDFGDYAVFARHWLDTDCNEPNYCEWADLDFNTSVDLADLEIFSGYWLWKKSEPIQGDFNQSNFVDFADFVILANRWMNSCVDPH